MSEEYPKSLDDYFADWEAYALLRRMLSGRLQLRPQRLRRESHMSEPILEGIPKDMTVPVFPDQGD